MTSRGLLDEGYCDADGEIVFDGSPSEVTADTLTMIYGEEDWSKTIRKVEDENDIQGSF